MWQNATEPCWITLNAEDYCRSLNDDNLKLTWFIGDPTPMNVEDILLSSNGSILDENQEATEDVDDTDDIDTDPDSE